jgi:hypothetical protein
MTSLIALLQAGLMRTVGNFVLSDLRRFEVLLACCWGYVGACMAVNDQHPNLLVVWADVGQRPDAALPHQRTELLAPRRHDRLPDA